MSLALRWKGGGTLPWDFIRFSRCQFWRLVNRSGFERMFARGRARAGIERPNSLKLSPKKNIFTKRGGNFKEFGLLAIEAPVACLYIRMMSAKFRTVKNYDDIEASRGLELLDSQLGFGVGLA